MKKNRFLKVAGLMMGATMLATCVFSGTMAKYKSEDKTAKPTLTAATWSIKLNDNEWASEDLSSLEWTTANMDGVTATKPANPAPGTWGYAPIKISNDGEVDAKITVTQGSDGAADLDSTGLKLVVFSKDEGAPQSSSEITGDTSSLSEGVIIGTGEDKTVYVGYVWDFGDAGDKDVGDTAKAGQSIEFNTLTIKAEQAKEAAPVI